MPYIEINVFGVKYAESNARVNIQSNQTDVYYRNLEVDQNPLVLEVPADHYLITFDVGDPNSDDFGSVEFNIPERHTAVLDLGINEKGEILDWKHKVALTSTRPYNTAPGAPLAKRSPEAPGETKRSPAPAPTPVQSPYTPPAPIRRKKDSGAAFVIVAAILVSLSVLSALLLFVLGGVFGSVHDPSKSQGSATRSDGTAQIDFIEGKWYARDEDDSAFFFLSFSLDEMRFLIGNYITFGNEEYGNDPNSIYFNGIPYNISGGGSRSGDITNYTIDGNVLTLTLDLDDDAQYGEGYPFTLVITVNPDDSEHITVEDSSANTTLEYQHGDIEELRGH